MDTEMEVTRQSVVSSSLFLECDTEVNVDQLGRRKKIKKCLQRQNVAHSEDSITGVCCSMENLVGRRT